MSEIPPIFVAAAKPPMRLVAVLKGDVNSQVVLVPRDSPITRVAQLKGWKVGYVRATTAHYLLLKLLEEHGLGFGDITPVALSPQDGRAAFERGSLDAWVSYGVQAEAVRATVGARVLTTGLEQRLSGNYLYAAGEAALNDPARRAAIVDYLARVQRSYLSMERRPSRRLEKPSLASAKATGVPAATSICPATPRTQRADPAGAGGRRGHRLAAGGRRRLRAGRCHPRPAWMSRLSGTGG